MVPRPQREHEKPPALQKRVLLRGLYAALRRLRGDARPATLSPCADRPQAQSAATTRTTLGLSQQVPHCPAEVGAAGPPTAPRLASVRAIRQLVCFRTLAQVCPPPRVARHLRAQKQSHAQWYATQDPCPGPQAQVVHPSTGYHCGRGQADLLCALAGRPVSRCPLCVPRFLFQTAAQSHRSGVHRMYGFGLLRQTGVARIHLALVLRNCQLLPQKPSRLEQFPRAILTRRWTDISSSYTWLGPMSSNVSPTNARPTSKPTATSSASIGTNMLSPGYARRFKWPSKPTMPIPCYNTSCA